MAQVHTSSGLRALRGKAAITGVATYGCGEAPGSDDMLLLARAAHAAVADAGLSMQDIDGLATCSVNATMWPMPVIEHLGINPNYINGTMVGGSSFIAHLLPSIMALEAGQCNHVLVCYGSAQRSAAFGRKESTAARKFMDPQPLSTPLIRRCRLRPMRWPPRATCTSTAPRASSSRPWPSRPANGRRRTRGLRARSALHRAGTGRPHGGRPPYRARLLPGDRWRRRLCAQPRSRCPARTERAHLCARQCHGLLEPPDFLDAGFDRHGRQPIGRAGLCDGRPDSAGHGCGRALRRLHHQHPALLEDLGFVNKGEAGAFVASGAIAPGGSLPVNTNGGGLSCVHPGMYGIFALIEAVRQLRGNCGERQVAGAQLALAHGNGGTLSSQATAILGTAATL